MNTSQKQFARVWDLPVRLFHWALVVLVAICFISIKSGNVTAHQYAGVSVLVLIVFRIIWGFIGSSTARFSDFIQTPSIIFQYIKTQKSPTEGHNPLGAWMVLALLGMLLIQTVTGLFLEDNTYIAQDSPLFKLISSDTRSILKQIHVVGELILYGLIGLHILAGIGYLLIKKQNLIRTMVTGKRPVSELHISGFQLMNDRPVLALIVLISLAILAYLAFFYPPTANALINFFSA